MKGYDLSPLDNNLLQFSRALSALAGVLTEETMDKAATIMGLSPGHFKMILSRSERIANDFEVCQDEDPMVTRRARATLNGDRDFTVNYDEGIEIVATDGRTLYDIDLNDNGDLVISCNGCTKHKGVILDDKLMIEPKSKAMFIVSRPAY